MERDSIVFYKDWWEAIKDLPQEKRLEAVTAVMEYAFTGAEPTDTMLRFATAYIRDKIDRDRSKFEEIRRKRKEAIEKRWKKSKEEESRTDTNVYKCIEKNTQEYKCIHTDTSQYIHEHEHEHEHELINTSNYQQQQNNSSRAREAAAAVDENLIEKFFAPNNQASLESLSMNLHCDIATMRNIAGGIVEEWKLKGVVHNEYKDAAQHLINTIRRKIFDPHERRRNPAAAGCGLGAGEWRDEQGRRRYARSDVIVPESAPPRPSDNHYWCPASLQWEKAI